jgi:hypothetical protein
MNKSIKCLISALALAVVTSAHAGAIVNVNASGRTKVFVDGRFVGMAPLQVRAMGPGWHTVMVQHARRGEARAFRIWSPRRRMVAQDIAVDWHRMHRVMQPVAAVAEPVGVVEPMPVAVDYPPAPVAVVQPAVAAPVAQVPPPQYDASAELQAERDKHNTTKALLGVAVANELLNKGRSKKIVRGVSIGGALLNEVAR